MTEPDQPTKPRGRPRVHPDAAARQRAWRERLAAAGKVEKRSVDKTAPQRAARQRQRKRDQVAAWREAHERLSAPDDALVAEVLARYLADGVNRHLAADAVATTLRGLELAPYRLTGPTIISFSGGRTSGYLLRRVLDAHDGILPPDVHVCFCNTGKERPETLDFVQECSDRWGVSVKWLEFDPGALHQTRTVDYATADRSGEPFEAAIKLRGYLPNPITRYCTVLLKIRRMVSFARDMLGWKSWDSIIGLRADEPGRVARLSRSSETTREHPRAPLAATGVTKEDVAAWWAKQPFDLRLPSQDGVTLWGNCDLCFLKRAGTIRALVGERPDLARWWAKAEALARPKKPEGARFRLGRATYRELLDGVTGRDLAVDEAEDDFDCHCHD